MLQRGFDFCEPVLYPNEQSDKCQQPAGGDGYECYIHILRLALGVVFIEIGFRDLSLGGK